ncbi:MAG: glycosyltransferase family 9 protein [Candidatus Omnitrophica bacterium]|nr:glycosyltransferase family 9 protein [Candidatus Omnitrophota bacterium]
MKYIFKNKFYIFIVSIVDFLGNIIFLPFKIFKKKAPGNIANILVIRLDHIGDVIFSTPIPQNLRAHYRGAKVTFLVGSWAKEIIINNPYVDEVICYDAPWFKRSKGGRFKILKFIRLAAELRRHNYDIGFDLRGDLRHILLMFLGGVKFRVSYGITGGGFMLHKRCVYREGTHSLEHNLDMLRETGVAVKDKDIYIYSSAKDKASVKDFLTRSGISENDTIAVVHPFAGSISKNWLDQRFAQLLMILHKDYDTKAVLVGSEKDKTPIGNIIKASQAPMLNAAGALSLGGLLELINKSKIFIGVDSGPSHIAALHDKPSVILYSGTNSPDEWGPLSKEAVVIQKEIPCKGCQRLNCRDNICMDLISVDDVIEAVEKVIKR